MEHIKLPFLLTNLFVSNMLGWLHNSVEAIKGATYLCISKKRIFMHVSCTNINLKVSINQYIFRRWSCSYYLLSAFLSFTLLFIRVKVIFTLILLIFDLAPGNIKFTWQKYITCDKPSHLFLLISRVC